MRGDLGGEWDSGGDKKGAVPAGLLELAVGEGGECGVFGAHSTRLPSPQLHLVLRPQDHHLAHRSGREDQSHEEDARGHGEIPTETAREPARQG